MLFKVYDIAGIAHNVHESGVTGSENIINVKELLANWKIYVNHYCKNKNSLNKAESRDFKKRRRLEKK